MSGSDSWERGDFVAARRQAEAVLAEAQADEAARERARRILASLRSDRAVAVTAWVALVVFVMIVVVVT